MSAALLSVLALLCLPAAPAQDPADPSPNSRARAVRVRSSVRIIIEDAPEGDYDHDFYEQPRPVEYRSGASGTRAAMESRVWFKSACRPQEDDRPPTFLPAPPPSLPLTVSGTVTIPQITVTTDLVTTGRTRGDPIITKAKAAASATSTSSDTRFMAGPDFDLQLESDLSGWSGLRWMPEQTSLHVYARALFGSFEVFGISTDLQMYGIGPRLAVPLVSGDSLHFGVALSAGPAFLHTGIGDALGFDGGIGLRLQKVFAPGLTFVAAVEANLYCSRNVTAFGPVVNLGFNVSW